MAEECSLVLLAEKKEIMAIVAPEGPVYQAGTLSGNPVAMSCGYTLLKELNESSNIYQLLEEKSSLYLENGFVKLLKKHHLQYALNRVGSMMSFHFGIDKVSNFEDACNADADLFKKVFHAMLNEVFI